MPVSSGSEVNGSWVTYVYKGRASSSSQVLASGISPLELRERSMVKLAGIESISGLRSPGPTSGTFSARQRNFVRPDALRDTTSSHPSLERVRMVTTELPTIQVFSEIAVSTSPGGLVIISLRMEFVGRESALAYE